MGRLAVQDLELSPPERRREGLGYQQAPVVGIISA